MEQQIIENGGLQYVPQIAVQYVYLDFDGELTSYNGEILTIDNVEVKDSALTEERIANILAGLNAKYASQNVIFVTDKPATAEYSTIYIGKTSAFDEYGNFAGLAETIDSGNKNKSDNAFVMLDSTNSNEKIISTISHETDHLLGTLDHGEEGLYAYADVYYYYNKTFTGQLNSSLYLYHRDNHDSRYESLLNSVIYHYNKAENVSVNRGGSMEVQSGGRINAVDINGGSVTIFDNGSANNTTLLAGTIDVYGGKLSDISISGGSMSLDPYPGGEINGVTIHGGTAYIEAGNVNDLLLENGLVYVRYDCVVNSAFIKGGRLFFSEGKLTNLSALDEGSLDIIVSTSSYLTGKNEGSDLVMQMNNGVMTNFFANSWDSLIVSYGGSALNTHLSGLVASADMRILNGALGQNTTVGGWAYLYVEKGGMASHTLVKSSGVKSAGVMYVSSGGMATDITIENGGEVAVYDYGKVEQVFVASGGTLDVWGWKATAVDIEVASGGTLDCNGSLSGNILLEGSLVARNSIDASAANIIVDLGDKKPDFVPIKNIEKLTDLENEITINVDSDIDLGEFILATEAENFQNSFILNVDDQYMGKYIWNESIQNYRFDGQNNSFVLSKDIDGRRNDYTPKYSIFLTNKPITILNFSSLKMAVSANWESYSLEFKVDDFKDGWWGKQTNKRPWARIEVSDLTFKASGAVNSDVINIHCKGKISGTMGILTVNGDLSGENQGLFLTISQDNEGEWQYTDWDFVGKLSVSIQKVDRRCAFKFGNKAFNTKELSGTLDINTKDGVYTITVDWERSAWKNFGSIQGQAVLKECTVNNEDQLDLSRVEISFQDKERNRIDPNIHFYSISGEFVNLASADTEPAYFKGTIGLTWMAATIKVGQSGWLKKILTESGISSNNSNTLTLSVVDTVLSVKMDTKNNFDASCIVNLLNIGEKSIGTIKGDLVYLSNTDSIRVTGQLDFAGIIGSDCVVIVEDGTLRAEAQTTVTLPDWASWITDSEKISGELALFSNGTQTILSVWGEITKRSGYKSVQGCKYDFTTGQMTKLDDTESIDALYEEACEILWRGNTLSEEYKVDTAAQDGTERLVFECDYSGGNDVQICLSNKSTGETISYSLSEEKKKIKSADTMSLTTQQGAKTQLLVFDENGFAVALENYSAGIWEISIQDNNSDLQNVDLCLSIEHEQTCKIEKFSVSNITACSADISYSVSGCEENTKIELYCRSLVEPGETYLLTEFTSFEDRNYHWVQDRMLNPGDYEFFIRVSGDIIPIESDGAGKFSISGEAEPVLLYDSIIYNGKATQIIPVFSKQYTRKEYSLNGTDYFEIADETSLIFDSSIKIYFRGYDESSDEYSDIYFHTLESKVNAGLFIWESTVEDPNYVLRISNSNKAGDIYISTKLSAIDFIGFREQIYGAVQLRNSGVWTSFNGTEISMTNISPQYLLAPQDNKLDLFAAYGKGIWEKNYVAQHSGILNGWNGTEEKVALTGKNKIADVFVGSSDSNVLVLTDASNGDALFVEDIYTSFGKDAARITQIDEIRAGLGDDIVDMTSQRFAYVGDGVKIYGGLGNDTIWSNNGSNILFGDAGNDRLVGGSDNDWIVGGVGNDTMHGGGGDDIFCFGGNFGTDTVEQLAGGEITLWFESGSADNWNADTLTYTDGTNSVTVSGVNTVTLKFGADVSLPDGCFADAASEKIFEDKNSGMLA